MFTPEVANVQSFEPDDAEMPYVVPLCTVTKSIPFHSIGDVSAMSPRLVCQSCFSVNGPGVPATSLLTPLRAESCSSSGQSSSDAVVVPVAVGVGEGEAAPDGEGLGDTEGAPDARAAGVCPCPLHAHRIAAAMTMINVTRREQRKIASHGGPGNLRWNPLRPVLARTRKNASMAGKL